ncbi:MAG TPA: hypothetical protein PLK94_13950, partial [Alphaproteobacteria bacterium]|nr:hypothetical protein [Alphaproteobacteria bacterium]
SCAPSQKREHGQTQKGSTGQHITSYHITLQSESSMKMRQELRERAYDSMNSFAEKVNPKFFRGLAASLIL